MDETKDDELNPETELEGEGGSLEDEDKDLLELARRRFEIAEESENDIRKQSLDDLQFLIGEQWPDNIAQDRNRDGRPCLTINRLPQFVRQVTNDQRQNRPGIKIHPENDGADEETAKIFQGIIRGIQYKSNSETAYDTAFEGACRGGLGYFRIITKFCDPMSFDKELSFKRIRNPFSVFFDPYSEEPDGSDAKFAFIVDEMSKDDYKKKYPKSKLATSNIDYSSIGNNPARWIDDESIRVAEYFFITYKKEIIHLLGTGAVVKDADLEKKQKEIFDAGLDGSIVTSRLTEIPVVNWITMNGVEVLERTTFPGSYIPIIPVYGDEYFVDGNKVLKSVIRDAKDSQRMYNYWKSAETETIALAPKVPFVAAEGQLEGYEQQWEDANRKSMSYLYYVPIVKNGVLLPPPQRQVYEPAIQAITQASMLAADDLKATTGVYDSALGEQSPDVSGIAIGKRQSQTQMSNFHLVDNLNRSIRHAGKILVETIPIVYDTPRTVPVHNEDGSIKLVRLNEVFKDESGEETSYHLGGGRYGVVVDTGPSFASKRQEAVQAMTQTTQAYPQLMGVAGDIVIKNMDWPGADEIAERIKLTLPPQLQADSKTNQIPPQSMAQIQQMQQMIKQLTDHLNETTKIIETKKLDLESKERIETMKIDMEKQRLQAEIEISLAKMGTQSSIALLQEEVGALKHQISEDNKRLNTTFGNASASYEAPNDFIPTEADGGNYAGFGHVGSGPTGGESPGISMEQ